MSYLACLHDIAAALRRHGCRLSGEVGAVWLQGGGEVDILQANHPKNIDTENP